MKRVLGIILNVVIVAVGSIEGQNLSDFAIISGRAVDIHGNPAAYAEITYSPGPHADMLHSTKADIAGRFELKVPPSNHGLLWVTGGIDWDNWRILIEPGTDLSSKYLSNKVIPLKNLGANKRVE